MAGGPAGHGQCLGTAGGLWASVGLRRPLKYLLSCVKTKYDWDWEMHLGGLSGG